MTGPSLELYVVPGLDVSVAKINHDGILHVRGMRSCGHKKMCECVARFVAETVFERLHM